MEFYKTHIPINIILTSDETVCITATFNNKSERDVKPYAKLVQKVSYYAEGHYKYDSKSWNLMPVVNDGSLNTLKKDGYISWNGLNFVIPPVSPSISLPYMIEVSYYLEVGLDIPMAFDLSVYMPIVVGTIPFRGQPTVVTSQISPPGYQEMGATPWHGTGAQSGVQPTAPPIGFATPQGDVRFDDPPPSYFNSVFQAPPTISSDDHFDERAKDKKYQ